MKLREAARGVAYTLVFAWGCGGSSGTVTPDAGQRDAGGSRDDSGTTMADAGPPQADAGPTTNPFQPATIEALSEALRVATAGQGTPSSTQLLLVPTRNNSFFTPATVGFARAAGELGAGWRDEPPIQTAMDTGATLDAKQIAIIQEAIDTRYYAGMAVSARNPTAEHDVIEAAIAANIEFITFDSDAANTSRSYYVGVDNALIGHRLGQHVRELTGGTGNYLVIAVNNTASNILDRYGGLTAELEGSGLTEVGFVAGLSSAPLGASCLVGDTMAAATGLPRACALPADSDPTDCTNDPTDRADCFEGILVAHPDVDVIIGLSSAMGPAAATALDATRLNRPEVTVLAMDGTRDNLQLLGTGAVDAVIAQRPFFYGYLSLYVLYALKTLGHDATRTLLTPWLSGTDMEVIDVGFDFVEQDTLDLYLSYLRSIGVSPT